MARTSPLGQNAFSLLRRRASGYTKVRRRRPSADKSTVFFSARRSIAHLKGLSLTEPQRGCCVARHTPISARREADASDLHAVRQAASLELLSEESAVERHEPLFDHVGLEIVFERAAGKRKYLLRLKSVSENVREEAHTLRRYPRSAARSRRFRRAEEAPD